MVGGWGGGGPDAYFGGEMAVWVSLILDKVILSEWCQALMEALFNY